MQQFFLVLLVLAFSPLAALSQETSLNVGLMLCQTGNCADWGSSALRGAKLAAEEVNSQGGVLSKKVNLMVEDTAESISGARAVTAFQRLLSQKIHFLIGPTWAPGALAIAPLAAKRSDILLITPSASAPDFSRTADYIFNMRPPEEAGARALAELAFQQGKKRAAIFGSQQAAESRLGRVFEEEFLKLGGVVTVRLEPDPSIADLRTEALKVVSTKPEVVFLINYNQMESGTRALETLGYKGMRMMLDLDEARIASLGALLNGVIVTRAAEPTEQFRETFRKRYGEYPGLSAENGYDAMHAMAQSIEEAKTFEIAVVKQKLAKGKFVGAIGTYEFNESREIAQAPVIRVVRDGKLVALE